MERFVSSRYDESSLKAALDAHFGDDLSYGFDGRTDARPNGAGANGSPDRLTAVCTDYAMAVYAQLWQQIDCQIVWIGYRESPDAAVLREHESHDFCLVLDRFIVDAWVKNQACCAGQAIFDLHDPQDQPIVERLYGRSKRFIRNLGLEAKARTRRAAAADATLASRGDDRARLTRPQP